MDINWDEAPEGATHYCIGSTHDTVWRDLSGVNAKYWSQGRWHDHHGVSSEFCLKYGVFEERPTQQAWDGKGLPPVGTVCEYYADEDSWRQCEIVAHKDGKAVVWVNHAHIWSTSSGAGFRPLKTKEQLAAEEREKAVEEMFARFGGPDGLTRKQCMWVISEGYRKQENNDAKA